ncbi:MAG: hypothetical protein ACFFCT_06955 [Candidatus Odinarchaeota archaeon]
MSKKFRGKYPGKLPTPTASSAVVDPDDIRKAIYHIDAYRSHIFYNLSFIDDMVKKGTLPRSFGENWKDLKRKLIKMAKAATSNPETLQLARYQSYTESAWQIAVPVVFVILIAGMLAPQSPILGLVAPFLMIIAFSAMILGLLGRSFLGARIARNIMHYFDDNPEAQKLRSDELRITIQALINDLRQILSDKDEDPAKHLVGLGLLDYSYIDVVKEPRPWRQYYLVRIILDTIDLSH